MKYILFYLLALVAAKTMAQDTVQIYNFGGKELEISSKYNCSEEYSLISSDFRIVDIKIPKWIYNLSDPEELSDTMDEDFEEKNDVLAKRKIEFNSFGQNFKGYLYKVQKEGRIYFLISSFGIIENAINLSIIIKDENLDIDHPKLPSELIHLIQITDIHCGQ